MHLFGQWPAMHLDCFQADWSPVLPKVKDFPRMAYLPDTQVIALARSVTALAWKQAFLYQTHHVQINTRKRHPDSLLFSPLLRLLCTATRAMMQLQRRLVHCEYRDKQRRESCKRRTVRQNCILFILKSIYKFLISICCRTWMASTVVNKHCIEASRRVGTRLNPLDRTATVSVIASKIT